MTPGDAAVAKENARAQAEKYRAVVRAAMSAAITDPNVALVLRHVARISGFFENPRVLDATGRISESGTIYNVGRESVYLDLRRMMTDEVRTIVERKGE